MYYSKVNYKIEGYTVTGIDRGLTEDDIKVYYRNIGYNAYSNYRNSIYEYNLSKEGLQLFEDYKDGYPDFILVNCENKTDVKFVEVKLDNDSLRPNQIHFNNLLSEVEDVTVAYFNVEERFDKSKKVLGISKFDNKEKLILKRTEDLIRIQKKKGFKPLWVVSELYKNYGKDILNDKILARIAYVLHLKKSKIVYFVKNVLQINKKKK